MKMSFEHFFDDNLEPRQDVPKDSDGDICVVQGRSEPNAGDVDAIIDLYTDFEGNDTNDDAIQFYQMEPQSLEEALVDFNEKLTSYMPLLCEKCFNFYDTEHEFQGHRCEKSSEKTSNSDKCEDNLNVKSLDPETSDKDKVKDVEAAQNQDEKLLMALSVNQVEKSLTEIFKETSTNTNNPLLCNNCFYFFNSEQEYLNHSCEDALNKTNDLNIPVSITENCGNSSIINNISEGITLESKVKNIKKKHAECNRESPLSVVSNRLKSSLGSKSITQPYIHIEKLSSNIKLKEITTDPAYTPLLCDNCYNFYDTEREFEAHSCETASNKSKLPVPITITDITADNSKINNCNNKLSPESRVKHITNLENVINHVHKPLPLAKPNRAESNQDEKFIARSLNQVAKLPINEDLNGNSANPAYTPLLCDNCFNFFETEREFNAHDCDTSTNKTKNPVPIIIKENSETNTKVNNTAKHEVEIIHELSSKVKPKKTKKNPKNNIKAQSDTQDDQLPINKNAKKKAKKYIPLLCENCYKFFDTARQYHAHTCVPLEKPDVPAPIIENISDDHSQISSTVNHISNQENIVQIQVPPCPSKRKRTKKDKAIQTPKRVRPNRVPSLKEQREGKPPRKPRTKPEDMKKRVIPEPHKPLYGRGTQTCHICKKTLSRQTSLTNHIRRRHTKETPYQCEHCEWKFVTVYDLDRHLLHAHVSEKRFSHNCDVCKKPFISQTGMEYHKQQCHITCNVCGLMVGGKHMLEKHMLTHEINDLDEEDKELAEARAKAREISKAKAKAKAEARAKAKAEAKAKAKAEAKAKAKAEARAKAKAEAKAKAKEKAKIEAKSMSVNIDLTADDDEDYALYEVRTIPTLLLVYEDSE